MLAEDDIAQLVRDMWKVRISEQPFLDNIAGYMDGKRGLPEIPNGADQEVRQLAALSVQNVLPLVRDAFSYNLSVIGYRDATAEENGPGWATWQANRMDSRQLDVYNPAITYGASYMVVTRDNDLGALWRPRSPLQMIAVYDDAQSDEFPAYAFETWTDYTGAHPTQVGALYDDKYVYPISLGNSVPRALESNISALGGMEFGTPTPHGASVCPVVRFINGRGAEDEIVGEIAPLLTLQKALNSVNFDSLIVGRFAAFPARVITGWSANSSDVLEASAKRVWAFDDPDVRAQQFVAADIGQYDARLAEMLGFISTVAQISPSRLNPKLSQVSADALAATEANEQRKNLAKQDSFGESWEQAFRLSAEITGDGATAEDSEAEVVWRETETRSFAAVVDGITKLVASGIPVENLVDMIPGISQAQVVSIKAGIEVERERKEEAAAEISAQQVQAAPPGPDAKVNE